VLAAAINVGLPFVSKLTQISFTLI